MVDHLDEGQGHPYRHLLVHFDTVTFLVDAAREDEWDLEEVVNLE